ncbi:hypothetical protein D3C85_1669560 [compost metagenome]
MGIALQAGPVSDADLIFGVIKSEVIAVTHDELVYELFPDDVPPRPCHDTVEIR